MDFLMLIFTYCAVFIGGALVLLYRDAAVLNTGPIGFLRQIMREAASRLIPDIIQTVIYKLVNYLLFKRNMAFQLLYIFGCIVAHSFWLVDIVPVLNKKYPHQNHTLWPFVAATLNYFFLHKAWTVDPGEVTKGNCEMYKQVYDCDEILYDSNNMCPTCKIIKPARSKHCSACDRCVHRFDHHCIWTNNCVGAFTHHYFILFMASLIVIYLQAIHISSTFLMEFAEDTRLFNASYLDEDDNLQPITISIAFQQLFLQLPRVVFLDLGCVVMTILVGIFLCHHLYLISTNQTTNERHKVGEIQWHYARLAWDNRGKNKLSSKNGHKSDQEQKRSSHEASRQQNRNKHDSKSGKGGDGDDKLTSLDRQTLMQVKHDKYRPYSRGIVNNFSEVFFPRRFMDQRLKNR